MNRGNSSTAYVSCLLGALLVVLAGCASRVEEPEPQGQGTIYRPASPLPERDAVALGQQTVTASRSGAEDFARSEANARQDGAVSVAAGRMFNPRPDKARDLLAYASPDEEIWVIARDVRGGRSPDDDAPGSGALVASLVDVRRDDTAPGSIRELPFPLKHTDVRAAIDGYIATVDVVQQFGNPFDTKIEAVYVFPLPEKAAVSEFVMTIGERRIRGILRERKEAEQIYREARAQGYRASLLTQHRPNVFEQKVANIEPGEQIDVHIRYFHTLAFRDGWYAFVLPTVVGPRYNPPDSSDPLDAVSRDRHADPPSGTAVRYLRPAERSGHDIGIAVDIDAGVRLEALRSTHDVEVQRADETRAQVRLTNAATIPNEDFQLEFRVAGERVKSALVAHRDAEAEHGYFTLMIYPPAELDRLARAPMEMVFVVDCSGSMSGRPLEQARAAIVSALDHLQPDDTFQIIRFSDQASTFGETPVAASERNLAEARRYVGQLAANGGTEMLRGLRASLDFPHDQRRLRIITFLTDGYIGNETDIIGEVHRRVGAARIFSFGVGSSVNRYLLERMAAEGRGAAAFLGLEDSASDVMELFFARVSHPALTDLEIDWRGLLASDVYPSRLPDLFVGRPVVVTGRFAGVVDRVDVTGRAGGETLQFTVEPDPVRDVPAVAQVWARRRIADLEDRQTWQTDRREALADDIRATALAYGLMSAYTSFIAVDASERTEGSYGTTVHQPVPVPRGVRYDTTVSE